MSEPALLADHIDEHTGSILAVWRATVEREGDVPEAERLSYGAFLDHVPELLDRLADRLRGRPADAATAGKKHGGHRWRQGYDIGQIINEFAHLRTALSRATLEYASDRSWGLTWLEAALEAINEVLAEATAQSVRQFQEDSEEELRRQHELFRTITEAQGEGLCTLDRDGKVTFVNSAAERLFGWSRDEIRGRSLHETLRFRRSDGSVYPEELCPLSQAIQSDHTVEGDEVFIRKDGREITIAFIASPIVTEGGRVGHVVVLRDISERIAQAAELERQRERAEEASQHKTRLVAALSHDVRTPLNAVVLSANLLEIHLDGTPDTEVQECLRTIRHSVRNVLDLIGDLLNLSKIEAGAVSPVLAPFPLVPVLAECLASIETQARIKGLEIRLEPGNIGSGRLVTDRAKLKQIVSNFLSNAVRYTERGTIRLGAGHRGGQLRIAVSDTGIGIDPKDQARIFDEFAMLEHPRRTVGEGTGLGLAICRRLAALLGGTITLESAPGRGSTFTLVLPGALLTAGAAEAAPDAEATPHRREAGSIIVAEDHDESRQTLAKVLRRMGYPVHEASNGRDALALIERERPLAVLMDVNMPIMNGVDAILALRADPRFRDLPVFALTGDVTVDNQQRIGEAGVNGYLEKPVTWDLLKQALASIGHPPAG